MKSIILVVDDETAVRFSLQVILEDAGHTVLKAESATQALDMIETRDDIDLIVSDLKMPGMSGMDLMAALKERSDAPKVVVVTAHGSERDAVAALHAGALDYYLPKPFEAHEIIHVVGRSLERCMLSRENRQLRARWNLAKTMVFASEAMGRVAELVDRVAARHLSVLITGESGVGKELIAEAIVHGSSRSDRPFVRFNCAALPRELIEAELFGHQKGAFTGAERHRPGLFREADGGTILLDEVGELDPLAQASLLRVLQTGAVRPVGSDREEKVDVRVLSATHRNLLSEKHGFRSDLYYRLNVVEIPVPPLRKRPDDILPLVRAFANEAARRFQVEVPDFEASALAHLKAQAWPGNVRELKHTVDRLVALATGPTIRKSDLDPVGHDDPSPAESTSLRSQVDAFEQNLIEATLQACVHNQSEAARRLQVSRGTLISKMKKYGISQP